MDQITYKNQQISWIIIVLLPGFCLFMAMMYVLQWGSNKIDLTTTIILSSVLMAVFLCFYRLTTYISGNTVHLKLGVGLIHVKLPIEELHEASITKVPLWYGIGIRITPEGMLYSAHGRTAVKVKYTGRGKTQTVLIGTSEPEILLKKIKAIK